MLDAFLRQNWLNWHVKKGKSEVASDNALKTLDTIDTKAYTDVTIAKDYINAVREASVAALSAAKKKQWPEAQVYISRSIQLVLDHYPLSETVEGAEHKTEYWDVGLDPHEAVFVCLRDILDLSRMLVAIFDSDELRLWSNGIFTILQKLCPEATSQRFAHIFLTEEGDYHQYAVKSYQHLQKQFSAATTIEELEQWVTVSARMFGRAVDMCDWNMVGFCLKECAGVLKSERQLAPHVLRDLVKNCSRSLKDMLLNYKYESWSKQVMRTQSSRELLQPELLMESLRTLTRRVFIGTIHTHA